MTYIHHNHDMIVLPFLSRVKRTTHKYGIEVPLSILHVKRIDAQKDDTFWANAITKEMANVGIAFAI